MGSIKKYKYLLIIALFFTVLYSLISFINHYHFRTFALDLGLYTNASFKYAHFQMADSTMIKEYFEPILGGHFDLYLLFISPFTYVFGTYTLLLFQIIALSFGGFGIYRYFNLFENKTIPIYATLYYYLFFGIYAAVASDYHSIVVASSLTPWFFVSVKQNRKWSTWVLFFLILVAQENIALWMCFICIGLLIEYRKEKQKIVLLSFLSVISLVYFLLVIHVVIPYFSALNEYGGFQYSSLGSNLFEAFTTIVTSPLQSIKILFTNHVNSPYGDFVKTETHLILMISGLFLLIKKPHFLIMLIPIYFEKFFHDNISMWGIGNQYNIQFAPILAIGIFSVISEFKTVYGRKAMITIILFMVTGATIRTMDNTTTYTDKTRIRFYKSSHYQKEYNVKNAHNALKLIPKNAKVSAQSPFVPHLCLRDRIYQFPLIKDADYIVYSRKEDSYPLSLKEFDLKIEELEHSLDWKTVINSDVIILKRRE